MKKYRVYDIDWDITENDIEEYLQNGHESLSQLIHDLAKSLPEETIVEIDEDDETDIKELIIETLSDDYDWCINSLKFEKIKGE